MWSSFERYRRIPPERRKLLCEALAALALARLAMALLPFRRIAAWLGTPGTESAPVDFSAEMFFEDGVSCSFYCSFIAGHQQWVHVSGQKGWLLLPDFVHPLNSYEPSFEVGHKMVQANGVEKCPAGVDPKIQGHAAAQDAIMWRNFAACILSGKLNPDWPMWAAKTQKVMDACLEAAREGRAMKL